MAESRDAVLHQPFEEEALTGCEPSQFYPVHIGQILNSRYRVLGKLGFGASSTIWLCQDHQCVEHTI